MGQMWHYMKALEAKRFGNEEKKNKKIRKIKMQVGISVTNTHENDNCSEYQNQYFLSKKTVRNAMSYWLHSV